jgi:hypothetical protein
VDAGEDTPPPPKPTCPEGQTMTSDGKCVTPPKPTCPEGQTMTSDGKCVTPPKPTCPEGQTMTSDGKCVAPPKPTCPDGQSMNDAGACIAPPTPEPCPAGQSMNSEGDCVPRSRTIRARSQPPVQSTPPAAVVAVVDSRTPAPAAQDVLGIRGVVNSIAATARMRGPRQCVARPFSQVVEGEGIRRVTVYVNGRKVRTMAGRSSYSLRIDPSSQRSGVIRIAAKVEFVASSGKRAQTLRVTALRCVKGAQQVKFAG